MELSDFRYVISDPHVGHVRSVERGWRPAGYEERIRENWKAIVTPEDTVLCLGDVVVGGNRATIESMEDLPGKVFFLKGNHDQGDRVKKYQSILGWTYLDPFDVRYRDWNIRFSHEPTWPLAVDTIQVHGHTHAIGVEAISIFHACVCAEKTDWKPVLLQELVDSYIARLEKLIATKHLLLAGSHQQKPESE